MDCNEVKEHLSAYHDDELASDIRMVVAAHLARCDECSQELAGFGELSAIARSLSDPIPPARIWQELETQLAGSTIDGGTRRKFMIWMNWTRTPIARIAWAAAAGILISVVWFSLPGKDEHHDEHQMAAVFGEYLEQFRIDPNAAQQILLANYEGRAVGPEQVVQSVGYRPLVAEGMPPGYSVVSTHVMKMPCCTCVHCQCRRSDGSTIAVFEHDDKEVEWFGDRAATETVCGDTRCSVFQLNDRIAATWQRGSRHITVIGLRDARELDQLVEWFGGDRHAEPM